jgi:sigma-B regulation protein RsbU (phosphoserine phosphatase)
MSADQIMAAPSPVRVDEQGYREGLDKIRKRFDIVEKANLALQAHESMDLLLPKILDLVLEAVKPERAALVQRNEDGSLICRAYRGKGEQMTISRTIADTVIDKRVSVLTSDAQTDERFAAGASIVAQGIQAVMGVPLWNSKEVIGLIYADSTLASGLFDDEDLRLLTMLANVAAIQIENAELFSEQVEKQRFEREAKAAADIQKRLLPRTNPTVEGHAFESHSEPCYECGGDYFDCLPMGEGRTAVVLADVAGKGMGAAMLMAVIQATLQARAGTGTEPDALAVQLGTAIARSAPSNRYATLFLMDLNHVTNKVRYVNAGHAPSPFLVRTDGEVVELKPGGTPLGLFPDVTYPVIELDLRPGDMIFACSDGVTDLENPEEEMFGEDRLEQFLRERAGRPILEIKNELDADMARFAQGTPSPDDLSYIILQRSD